MPGISRDAVYAWRTLRRRRGFTAIAVTTLALGIGMATAIYSVVDGVLFRPLAFPTPSRLIAVWQTYPYWLTDPILRRTWDRIPLSIPEYRDWREAQTSFTDVAIWAGQSVLLRGTQERELVSLTRASASLLPVLGVSPVLGRNFTALEDAVGGAPVTMLSYENWQSRFAGDAAVIGRVVHFNDQPYTIVGVLPPGLSLTRTNSTGIDPPFWIPVGQDSMDSRERSNHSYRAVARLKPGVTLAQATMETERILRGDRPPERRGVRVEGFHADQTRDVRKPLLLLLAAVALLLLIACVNVAILLLGEATARESEIASRVALGAGRARVMRQLLTESLVLALMGAALGSALAWGMTRVLVALAPTRIPGLADVHMDMRVLGFALGAATLTGILFGLAPALTLLRASPAQILRASAGQSSAGRGQLQRAFIAIELALSLMLLVGAALVMRSFARLTAVNIGFRPENLLLVRTFVPASIGRDTSRNREFYRAAIERLSAVPGVVVATATSTPPFGGGSSSTSIEVEGQVYDSTRTRPEVQQRTTVTGFFQATGIPLIAGRVYDERDQSGGPPVIVVSQETARRNWPDESPIGKRVRYQGSVREVIGIVGDIKFLRLSTDYEATVYLPHAQRPGSSLTFLVRTQRDPFAVVPAIREAIRTTDASVTVTGTERTTDLIRRASAEERYRTVLVSLFGVMAAVLAAVGMYGVTARAVSRRTREFGIRIALGASARSVTGLVTRYTLVGVAIGVVAGLAVAMAAARFLAPFLYNLSPTDAISYAGAALLLTAVSVAASIVPARRAARVEPASVLRVE